MSKLATRMSTPSKCAPTNQAAHLNPFCKGDVNLNQEELEFAQYTVKSNGFHLIVAFTLVAGSLSARWLARRIRDQGNNPGEALLGLACAFLCLTAITWGTARQFGFAGYFARELMTLYSAAYALSAIWQTLKSVKPKK